MSLGYRLHVIAVGGGLAAFLLLTSSALAQEAESSGIAAPQSNQTKSDSAAAEFHPTIGQDEAQAAKDAEARERGEQAAKDDLLAQQSMAGSTEDLVDLTGVQIGFSFVETILLITTTVFTAFAAIKAGTAAEAAVAAVNVADLARVDADGHANLQSRAYVHVEQATLLKPDPKEGRDIHLIKIVVRNFGHTPAHDLVFNAKYDIRETRISGPSVDGAKLTAGPCSLAPQADIVFHLPLWPIHAINLGEIESGAMALFVIGGIIYRDVFESDDPLKSIPFTDFMMVYRGAVSASTRLFANYIDGNSAG